MEFLSSKLLALTLVLIFLAAASSVHAQDSPQDFLYVHNAARAEVGVQPLTWDDRVASYAQYYADQRAYDCGLVHSGGPYGENIAMSPGDMSAVDAARMWVGEKPQYDPYSNSCFGGQCLHYTQVVWSGSTSLGCAKVRCGSGGTFITCNYYPPGNYQGQRPY
uniref:SCP domain-containing protein n=1 Tax=Kalanchoe fedtschenkoi TaxID=63787 RepID=A0A7N0V507_KALFE